MHYIDRCIISLIPPMKPFYWWVHYGSTPSQEAIILMDALCSTHSQEAIILMDALWVYILSWNHFIYGCIMSLLPPMKPLYWWVHYEYSLQRSHCIDGCIMSTPSKEAIILMGALCAYSLHRSHYIDGCIIGILPPNKPLYWWVHYWYTPYHETIILMGALWVYSLP